MIWQNFTLALSRYFDFNGRSRRAEFWGFILISTLIGAAASAWDSFLFDSEVIENVAEVLFFVPTIAVAARRLHDTGRSGWWQLIIFTGIGIIPLIFWYCQDSDASPNKWGSSPKYGVTEEEQDTPTYHDDQIV